MPWKDKEKRRAALRKHYRANKQIYVEKSKRQKAIIRAYISKIKEDSPCVDCGQFYPGYVMDFDHLEDKKSTVSSMVNNCNIEEINKEIAKCDIVCSNCHRLRTHARKNVYVTQQ